MKKGTLNDPKKIARDVSNIGHWGNGDYEIKIKDSSNLSLSCIFNSTILRYELVGIKENVARRESKAFIQNIHYLEMKH